MKENQKKQLKSIIFSSLLWLIVFGSFFYIISSVGFKLIEDDPIELGRFKLKNGITFELKSYNGNAISSSELHIEEIHNFFITNSRIIKIEDPYNDFVEWRQLNDSLILLILQNSNKKDTIYVLLRKEEITLGYEPIYNE